MIDEDNLTVIIRSLQSLRAGHKESIHTISSILQGLQEITLVDGQNPTDSSTGQTMTQERRDEVYDKCLPVVNELLGI